VNRALLMAMDRKIADLEEEVEALVKRRSSPTPTPRPSAPPPEDDSPELGEPLPGADAWPRW